MRAIVLLLVAATAEAGELETDIEGYLAAASTRPVRAAAAGDWQWSARGGLWVVSSEATISKDSIVGGGRVDVSGELGYGVGIDAFRGPFGISLEGTFLDVDDTIGGVPAQAEHATLHPAAFRRFGEGDTVVDALAGFRLVFFSTDLQNGSVSRTWWDPTLGVRASHRITDRLRVTVRGDIGGFNLGSASDLTWQIEALVLYGITPRAEIAVGYRHLDIDYSTGGLRFDQRAGGPMVAVYVTF